MFLRLVETYEKTNFFQKETIALLYSDYNENETVKHFCVLSLSLLSLTPKQVMAALQITVFQCSHQLSLCIVSAHGRSKQRMLF